MKVGRVFGMVAAERGAVDLERGGASGLRYAKEVRDGGTGRALAGHGELRPGAGQFKVPEGTTLTVWVADGAGLKDSAALLIEAGEYDKIPLQRVEGARSFLPGAMIDNYTLKAPDGLVVLRNSTTVEDATRLSDLLKPNQGHVDWAACLKYRR